MPSPTELQLNPAYITAAAVVLGLAIGSFLNVVIHRLPAILEYRWRSQCRELTGAAVSQEPPPGLIRPRSHCPHCGRPLRALENIPVASFIVLRGRCAGCNAKISWRYPAVEVLCAAASGIVAWRLGWGPIGFGALLFTWGLIALAFIDLERQILPDAITLPALWLGLLVNLSGAFAGLGSAVLGAAAGYLSLWLLYHGFRLMTGKEGMGYGDFKLFAAIGAWVGWQNLVLVILLASAAGAAVGVALLVSRRSARGRPIPFGPFLAAAGWIALLWGPELTRAYLRFAGIAF